MPEAIKIVNPEDFEGAVRAALRLRPESIIVGGGDGSVATAAGLIAGSDTALGVLPMGTFNLVARDLGIPLDPKAGAAALATARPGRIDVATVNGRPYLCVCILGFYPNLVFARDGERALPWWRKTLGVFRLMFRAFRDYPPLHISVVGDAGAEGRYRSRFAAIVNNPYTDEPGLIPTRASLDSGNLAVYVGRHRDIRQFILGGLAFIGGRMMEDPNLLSLRGTAFEIDISRRRSLRVMIDGENVRLTPPLRFSITPRHLSVLLPAPGEGERSR